MAYELRGRLLEVCDCKVLCPCWIGEDPDGGTCAGTISWHIDSGTVNGVDVSGRTITAIADIPGNVLGGNWKVLVVIDDGATDEQQQALLDVWTGQLGGPVADLSGLIGEVAGVVRAPVKFTVEEGQGVLRIGDLLEAEVAPYQGATGQKTALNDTVFSTIPGSPAYVSKASSYRRTTAEHGISPVDIQGHNAVQGDFYFEAA